MARSPDLRMIFDYGQIVIYGTGRTMRPTDVKDALWDPYIQAWRSPACRYRHLQESLVGHGHSFLDGVGLLGTSVPMTARIPPMRWERFAVDRWDDAGQIGTVVYPARSNRIAVAVAAMVRIGRPVIIVVTAMESLALWERKVRIVYKGPMDVMGANRHVTGTSPVVITLAEHATYLAQHRGHQFTLLVVDGLHRLLHEPALRAGVESIAAPYRLGLAPTMPSPVLQKAMRATEFGNVVFSPVDVGVHEPILSTTCRAMGNEQVNAGETALST